MESGTVGRLPLREAGRSRTGAVIATMRPKQWLKNALVITAAGAAGALGHDGTVGRVTAAGAAFCLLASGIYAINDVRDAEEDRLHPRKRVRPVAAGEIDPRFATALGLSLLLAGILLCMAIGPLLGLVGVGYAALTLSYTSCGGMFVFDIWRWRPVSCCGPSRRRPPFTLSRWFLLVVTSSAVFVAAASATRSCVEPIARAIGVDGGSTPTVRGRSS